MKGITTKQGVGTMEGIKNTRHTTGGILAGLGLLAVASLSSPVMAETAAEPGQQHQGHATTAWAEQLKGQTILEDVMEGRPERTSMVERQHHRIMEQMQHDADAQRTGGFYNNVNMMHQYGAGNQDVLLMSNTGAEPVSSQGGRCPAAAPVRQYDVSAINVEISLNMWLDFYPGYMYVLTENIDKVRAEETKNREARDKDGYNPGAVRNGLQNHWIQPLAIRGNQGDCVKITLRNQLEGSEEVSLNVHGSSMIVASTGQPATTTNPDSIVAQGKTVELEWYIPPTQQEGGRQFHSYSNDRELTVMGLFGTFVIEPKGSEYYEPLGTGDPTVQRSGW